MEQTIHPELLPSQSHYENERELLGQVVPHAGSVIGHGNNLCREVCMLRLLDDVADARRVSVEITAQGN